MNQRADVDPRPDPASWRAFRPLAFLGLLAVASAGLAQEKSVAVGFRLPDDAEARGRATRAADWLRRHIETIERPGGAEPLRVVAWPDPTLAPDSPGRLAGYLITDTLWAAEALKPFDPEASAGLSRTLDVLGWTGNGLQEVLFRPVARMRHRSDDADPVHGRSLGVFPIEGGRTVDVRVMAQREDPAFEAGHPALFAEHAVYQALHDFWEGRGPEARRRVAGIVRRDAPDDPIFWDADLGVLVDRASREDWRRLRDGERPTCRVASFKLGVLVYAIRLMGMEAEVGDPLGAIRRRLATAQREDGGYAHFVEVGGDGAATLARSGPTGEATAAAILSETVVGGR